MNHAHTSELGKKHGEPELSVGETKAEQQAEPGLPELEVLAVLAPGTCHSRTTLATVSGLSLRTIRAIEKRALAKIRASAELSELLREARPDRAA